METKNSVGPTTLIDGRSAPAVDTIIRQVSKAELLVGLGQVDEAISTLKEILRQNPDSTHAHMKLKDVFLRAGMRTQAAEECLQLARICEAQGDLDAARDYIARARLLSPSTATPSATPRAINEAANRVPPPSIPPASTPAVERSRPEPPPETRTIQEAPRAISRPEQPIFANKPGAPQVNAGQTAASPIPPPVAAPTLSGPAPRNPVHDPGPPPPLPRASVPPLPIDRGSPPSKYLTGDLRVPSNGKPSLAPGPDQIVVPPVSAQVVEENYQEVMSDTPIASVADPAATNRSESQAPTATARPAKLIVSSKAKSGRARRWLYAATAILCLSGAGVAGLFWYDARLNTDYIVLNNQYEEMAHASAVALAQADVIDVTADETILAVEPDEAQSTKPEQESLDTKTPKPQPTLQRPTPMSVPPLPRIGETVADLRPEPKQNRPAPPMTSPVNLTPAEVADGRGLAPVGSAPAAAPPPAPPPASTQTSGKVVVAAEATSRAQPSYPRAASLAGVSGSVAIQVSINERGSVIDARAVSGPPLLRDAAVNAARRWRFTPSTIGGVPVKATKTIVFNFKADR
jgi:TonB family protein